MNELKRRLAPFLVLLEARYLPLLFAASPQAYTVYRWLWEHSDNSMEAWVFSVMGGLGYEFVYVGAIAWAEEGRFNGWTWATALSALVFSISVAIYVHRVEGYAAILHAGFPLVAFCYTMAFHGHKPASLVQTAEAPATTVQISPAKEEPVLLALIADLQDDVQNVQEDLQEAQPDLQKPAKVSDDAWQAWQLLQAGKTQAEIASLMQKSISTISRYCTKVDEAMP